MVKVLIKEPAKQNSVALWTYQEEKIDKLVGEEDRNKKSKLRLSLIRRGVDLALKELEGE
jgi:hypothetical protein